MDTVRGILKYSPQEPQPIQISNGSGKIDLWPLLEPTFWSLCGLYVAHDAGNSASYSLALDKERNWVLHYESREKISLRKPGQSEHFFDVASRLDSLLTFLNAREVTIEADREHLKISAVVKE
jgi:hypothetical protein